MRRSGGREAKRPAPKTHLASGVALLSFASLLLQVALTRLCSAALNYHLTFLVVGAALLGTGAGGTWVALRQPAGVSERRILPVLAFGTAGSMALVGAAFAWAPLRALGGAGAIVALLAAYPLFALPYGLTGAAVAIALRRALDERRTVHGVYGAALLGAAAGCAGSIVSLNAFGPPWTVSLAALIALGAGLRFGPVPRGVPLASAILVVSLAAPIVRPNEPNVLAVKPLASFLNPILSPDSELTHTRWDATSRVDVFDSPGAQLLWHTPSRTRDPLPDLRGITIDADALTAAAKAELDGATLLARRLPTSLPFAIAPRDRVLVIGSGGGLDVEAALAFGARDVDAVEVNRGVAQMILGPLSGFTNDVYRRRGVHLTVDEGRAFLRRAAARGDRYDAIVLTAVDSWAALTAGAYSLTESTLYTREAFDAYYARLTEGGVLAVSRWYTQPPREVHRLAELARLSIAGAGGDAVRQVMLQRAGQFGTLGTLLVKRGTFSPLEVDQAQSFGRENGYGLAYTPGVPTGEFAPILAGLEPGSVGGRTPTDDRPFFFDHVPWWHVLTGRAPWPLPQGHAVLIIAVLQSVCLAIAAVVLPVRRRTAPATRGGRGTAYFALVGLGFALAEMGLLQRAGVLIGLPAVAFGAIVAGMLAGAGSGSIALGGRPRLRRVALTGGALALWVAAPLSGLLPDAAGAWPLEARAGLALAGAACVGFLLGAAVPAGLAALPVEAAPWAWGVNGAASVVGTGLAVLISMEGGIGATIAAAGGCYAVAAGLLGALNPAPVEARFGRFPGGKPSRRGANPGRMRYSS